MDCRFGRSNHSNTQYQFNTSIHKWNDMKLLESFPIVPILMDYNCGRFFNSKSPPKSLKLYWPIWMDSNDSQFNMWNDFDSLFLASFFLYKLGIFFIIAKPSHIDWNSFHWIQTIWFVSFQFRHHTSIETSNLFYQFPFAPNTLCNHISALSTSYSILQLAFICLSLHFPWYCKWSVFA